MILLQVSSLSKSVYYYTLSKIDKDDKNKEIIDKIKTLDELILAINDYINYYNYDRIKVKLKGLSPVNYRLQSSD